MNYTNVLEEDLYSIVPSGTSFSVIRFLKLLRKCEWVGSQEIRKMMVRDKQLNISSSYSVVKSSSKHVT